MKRVLVEWECGMRHTTSSDCISLETRSRHKYDLNDLLTLTPSRTDELGAMTSFSGNPAHHLCHFNNFVTCLMVVSPSSSATPIQISEVILQFRYNEE